jgi:hypothetical protein
MREAHYASASEANNIPIGSGCDARHHRRGPKKVDMMKNLTHTSKRVAASMLTMVALISTVGAPFKWSMSRWLW